MRIGGGVRSLNARIARLEAQVVAPQGPTIYRVLFHDGTPMFPKTDEQADAPFPASRDAGDELIFRIASWEESALGGGTSGLNRR